MIRSRSPARDRRGVRRSQSPRKIKLKQPRVTTHLVSCFRTRCFPSHRPSLASILASPLTSGIILLTSDFLFILIVLVSSVSSDTFRRLIEIQSDVKSVGHARITIPRAGRPRRHRQFRICFPSARLPASILSSRVRCLATNPSGPFYFWRLVCGPHRKRAMLVHVCRTERLMLRLHFIRQTWVIVARVGSPVAIGWRMRPVRLVGMVLYEALLCALMRDGWICSCSLWDTAS